MSEITLSPVVAQAYSEMTATPFYQDDTVYRFAKHLIISEANTSMSEMKTLIENNAPAEVAELSASYQAILDTISQLDDITIPKADFEAWVLQRIKSGTMNEYVRALDDLFARLMIITYQNGRWRANEQEYNADVWIDTVYDSGKRVTIVDYTLMSEVDDTEKSASEYVLNRKNPFADVSIKNQRFLYASDYERFNALELRTSRKVTKIDKDETRAYVTLQPGFNIRNSPKVEGGAKSNIRFDDTLTTELTQNDDKTYVYLDVNNLASE